MSRISMISSTSPMAAIPHINSTANVKDSDMARSLVGLCVVTVDLRARTFHDRVGRYVPLTPGHRPEVQNRARLGIAQSIVKRPCSGVVVLHQHPGHRPTMIDD